MVSSLFFYSLSFGSDSFVVQVDDLPRITARTKGQGVGAAEGDTNQITTPFQFGQVEGEYGTVMTVDVARFV